MNIVVIFLILFNFCSADINSTTNICQEPSPCIFNITKEYPLSPKIPSKYIHYQYKVFYEFYGFFFEFNIPEYQALKSFYIEAYDESTGENIMKDSDCILINTTYFIDELILYDKIMYSFDFAKPLDNIDFIQFRFFGLSDNFSMNVVLHINEKVNFFYDLSVQIVVFLDVDDGIYKTDIVINEVDIKTDIKTSEPNTETKDTNIEVNTIDNKTSEANIETNKINIEGNTTDIKGNEEIKEEEKENKAELDECRDLAHNKIIELAETLFTTNIDVIIFGKEYFGSITILIPFFRITFSYVVGYKYSSENYYELGIPLFNSKIAKGSINLDWGSYAKFIKNVEVSSSNPFLGLLDIFQNHAANLALKLVIQNDNFYFTIKYRNYLCMVYTFRFYLKGELGPYYEIEIEQCLDIKDVLERVTNSIKDFYESIDPEWQPFVLGVCLGVVIGLAPVGASVEAGLSAVYTKIDVTVTNIYVGLGTAGAAVTNWLSNVKQIDFVKIASDGISDFTSGLVSEVQNLGTSISSWLQGSTAILNWWA